MEPVDTLWNSRYAAGGAHRHQADAPAFAAAAEFLNRPDIKVVEDWGCGVGHFRPFLAPHQKWVGIDGSSHSAAGCVVDLIKYHSQVDAIHMRGVIEHNLRWEPIWENALGSFTKRAVLTVYEPLVDKYAMRREGPWVVQQFTRNQLLDVIGTYDWVTVHEVKVARPKNLPGEETLFCLER